MKTKLDQLQEQLKLVDKQKKEIEYQIKRAMREDLSIKYTELGDDPKPWDLDTRDLKERLSDVMSVSFDAHVLEIELTLTNGDIIVIS